MGACSGHVAAMANRHAIFNVWGPGSWGRTDLSPRSSGGRRQAGQGRTGLDLVNSRPAPSAIRRWMHFRVSAMRQPTFVRNLRRHQMVRRLKRLRLHRARTMVGPMCCCTSRCCGATAFRPPMKARGWWSNAFSARRAVSGLPHRLDGRIDRHPSCPDVAAADPCQRHSDQRARAGPGQMVQPAARLRLPDLRGGHPRHLRAHGNAAPLRHDRAAYSEASMCWCGSGPGSAKKA